MSAVRIVIADVHSQFTANMAEYFLRRTGIEVLAICTDGNDLISHVRRLHPDAVLMDVVLESLDGISVLKRLRSWPDDIAYIVCTEFVSDESISRASQYGASAFMCKPVERNALFDTICETVALKKNGMIAEGNDQLNGAISSALRDIGISAGCKGFRLLEQATRQVLEQPALLSSLTKLLYPQLATAFHTTTPCIERNIRSAIARAHALGMLEICDHRPTNREVIAHLVHAVRVRSE